MKMTGQHRTFNIQRSTFNEGQIRAHLDVERWALNVECFPPVQEFNARIYFGEFLL
jgi:hypothetical protein